MSQLLINRLRGQFLGSTESRSKFETFILLKPVFLKISLRRLSHINQGDFMKLMYFCFSLIFASTAHASIQSDVQGHWTRYGVRCSGSSQIWQVPTGVTLDISGKGLISRSVYATGPQYAETETEFLSREADKILTLEFEKIVRRPYRSTGVTFYDFMDNKTTMEVTLAVQTIISTPTLILGGIYVDAAANGCAKDLEFLYSR